MPSSIQEQYDAFSKARQNSLSALQERKQGFWENLFLMIKSYEKLGGFLYRLRKTYSERNPLRQRHEEAMAQMSQEWIAKAQYPQKTSQNKIQNIPFTERYRQIWRENLSLLVFNGVLFLASALLGAYITFKNSDHALAILPQSLLEKILKGEQWFKEIQSNPVLEGFLIAWNNIWVSVNAFLLAALFGIGGVYILCFNGLMLGVILAYAAKNGFEAPLVEFILSHGFLELSIIVSACFSGFLFGRVFYMRPYRFLKTRMRLAAEDAKTVLIGILPWLVLAACIEVFVSPWNYLGFLGKVFVSLVAGLAFWVWTFWPEKLEGEELKKKS